MRPQGKIAVCRCIEMRVNQYQQQLESIRRGFAEIDAGHYIPHEPMKAWLLSFGSDHELPPPNYVCGKPHDEPARCE
jgi:predicted transcriptional regulator